MSAKGRAAVLLVLFLITGNCTGEDDASTENRIVAARQHVPAPPGHYIDVAWFPDGFLVANELPGGKPPSRLVRFALDGSNFEVLDLARDPACVRTQYESPFVLPDGRIGAVKECEIYEDVRATYSIVAYEPDSGKSVSLFGPPSTISFGKVAISPSMSKAVVGSGNGICNGLLVVDATGAAPLDLTIADDGTSWNASGAIPALSGEDCPNEPDTGPPAWEVSGPRVAFFGSGKAIGLSGFDRASVPLDLFIYDTETKKVGKVLSRVVAPHDLEWSPDGEWLAFGGKVAGGQVGVYSLHVQSRQLIRVADMDIQSLAWAPSGRELAVTQLVYNEDPLEFPMGVLSRLNVTELNGIVDSRR